MKEITCATLVTNLKHFLVCHPTGQRWDLWGLPKGIRDKNESLEEAAVRELFEETNIKITKYDLKRIGIYPYNDQKDYALFLYITDILPSNLKCTSYFTNYLGKQTLEIDGFKYIEIEKYDKYLNPKQKVIITDVFKHVLKLL